ncbi:DNA topoisomerase 2-alpha-like isoform X2 [Tachypleus tridentatus]|uniref:DNA topoisomerase 2-alpha-like isoform X2 n=1 Tax=Tachypleus tridentatus TaxID=6853 RepID=UPI003FD5DC92
MSKSGNAGKSPLRELFANIAAKQTKEVPLKQAEEQNDGDMVKDENVLMTAGTKKSNKRLSVERIYQKKSQLEHILLRPDTYIGSTEPLTQQMWVYDEEAGGMVHREITFVPGLYKVFDEILVNAADNKQRDKKMDCIKIEIDQENNKISVWNNGKGIPVVEHKDEKMYVPTLIFGHLLTSSNYNDDEKKVTGGRNGYGAKLCNIFSTKFIVETASKESGKSFKQVWMDNMAKTTDAKIKPFSGEDFTCITFYPDLAKFKMEKLEKDLISLLSRRAFDIAGTSRGVKVILNGKRLPVKGFKDYVEQYVKGREDEDGNPLKVVYDNVSERWEIAVTLSAHGFQQVSFVNSIATTKGGRHVDYVSDQIINKLVEAVKKKNKGGIQVKPFQIRNHMWIFVNALIENPTFDSQTKENMTLQSKNFGSKCQPGEKFFTQVLKCGIVESIMNWVKFKAQTQLNTKCSSKKHSKLKGVPKLEDANDAGTKNSINCTLILTEGDSAKSLAVSGLGVVGRDKYGVFPLKGKILNVREATHKQILENAEINNIIKIMGLQYKKKYESMEDLKSLRYGRLMIMTDQDQDGSHIKGLLINFIHHNWPSLLRLPFLEEFITPIVKVTKGKEEKSFFSLPEFEEWKTQTSNWNTWKVKYYKGLGTSTAKEAKEYFGDMNRHRIKFQYQGPEDDEAIQLAFSKKMIEQRKDWLFSGMEERKQRRELGLPELYLYEKTTTHVTYNDFVNRELILFSNMDNERSIPSLVDGLKPGQRKVIFTCFKRNDKREIKVAQLAGSVAEHSAYHHGETSLMATIINLAQNFVGSNNINLLQPIGQFGTRLQGGKDSASPRYIFTMLSPLARHIFPSTDDPLLCHLYEDNQKIEPEYYVPIIPMLLVNGAEGIGTGWSTKIPNYNPREIIDNIQRMLDGEEPQLMKPWFKNFKGTIEQLDSHRYVISGEVSVLEKNKIEVTELPVRTWTQQYKEQVLEPMLYGTEKVSPLITDYKEYHTDTTVKFVVSLSEDKLAKIHDDGLHKVFKLQSSITTTSMVLFDHNGVLKRYDTPEDILKEFFNVRLDFYNKRKDFLEGMLSAESRKLENQARFILEKIEGTIVIENKKKLDMIQTLIDRGYDSDPVKLWKKEASKQQVENENSTDSSEEETEVKSTGPDYDYLLGMNLWSLTKERKDELLKKRDDKRLELQVLQKKNPTELWKEDLVNFLSELDKVEQKEREDENEGLGGKPLKFGKAGKGKGRGKKINLEETQPSPIGERVIPRIDPELKKRAEKALKEGKGKKPKENVKKEDDSDEPKPLSSRLKNAAKQDPGKHATGGMKQSKLSFLPMQKKQTKKNSWSGSDSELEISSGSDFSDFIPEKREVAPKRIAASKVKYNFDSEDEIGESENSEDGSFNPGDEHFESGHKPMELLLQESDEENAVSTGHNINSKKSNQVVKGHQKKNDKTVSPVMEISDIEGEVKNAVSPIQIDGTDLEGKGSSEKEVQQTDKTGPSLLLKPAVKVKKNVDKKEQKKATTQKRPLKKATSEDSDDQFNPKHAKTVSTGPSKKKKAKTEDSEPVKKVTKTKAATKNVDSDEDIVIPDSSSPPPPPRSHTARSRARIVYNFDSSDEEM